MGRYSYLFSILLEVTRALAHIGILIYIHSFAPNKFLAPLLEIGTFINIDLKWFYYTLDIVSLIYFIFLFYFGFVFFFCFVGA